MGSAAVKPKGPRLSGGTTNGASHLSGFGRERVAGVRRGSSRRRAPSFRSSLTRGTATVARGSTGCGPPAHGRWTFALGEGCVRRVAVLRARCRLPAPISDSTGLAALQRRKARPLLPLRQAGTPGSWILGENSARGTSLKPRRWNRGREIWPRFARSFAKNKSAAVSPRRSEASTLVRERR